MNFQHCMAEPFISRIEASYDALEQGEVEAIKALTDEVFLERFAELLHDAVQHGNRDFVKQMLEAGWTKHIDYFDELSFTPLMWAAVGNNIPMVELLLSFGANVNAHEEERIGNTALREVATSGTFEMAQVLLNHGADPLIPGWMQINAIMAAQSRFDCEKSPEAKRILDVLKSNCCN